MNISTNLTQEVVVSQCKAWFYLHHILTKRWREEFKEYLSTIRLLHKLMRKQRAFLQGRFEERRPDIEKGRKKGAAFNKCRFCGFEASIEKQIIIDSVAETHCLVCEEDSRQLKISCPECGKDCIYEFGEGNCGNCAVQIGVDHVFKVFEAYQDQAQRIRAYCSRCQHIEQPTVVSFKNKWVCLCCFEIYDYPPNTCDWCGHFVTGDTGDRFSPGCIMCAVEIYKEDPEFIISDYKDDTIDPREKDSMSKRDILTLLEDRIRGSSSTLYRASIRSV